MVPTGCTARSPPMLAKRIYHAIKARAPMNICDQCLGEELGLSAGAVGDATGAFGLTSEFSRYPGLCSRCGQERLVTRSGS